MELQQRDRLSELVEDLTTSGELQLNQDKMKEVKKICKESNDCIDHVYHLVMSQLNQEHAEIRFSAFQIASELFSRSHHFRTLLVDNLQDFLELTVETDSEQPLPPPKHVAKKLKLQAIQTVQAWQVSYGAAYKKLGLGYHFLKQIKKVDFDDIEARTIAERRREEERRQKMERIYKERLEAATREMEEMYQEIKVALTEMESCMALLFPGFEREDIQLTNKSPPNTPLDSKHAPGDDRPCCSKDLTGGSREGSRDHGQHGKQKKGQVASDDEGKEEKKMRVASMEEEKESPEDATEEAPEEESGEEDFIRNAGIIAPSYRLDLDLSPVFHIRETDDNEAVISTILDLHRLLTTKHLPAVQAWVQVFTKSGAEQHLLRRALDLKVSVETTLQKHKELYINCKTRIRKVMKSSPGGEDVDDDDDDSDFDEVPEKEGYEPCIPKHLWAEYGLDSSPSTSAADATKKPPANPSKPLPPPPSSNARRLKQLLEEEKDPTCAAATLHLLRKNLHLPSESSASEPSTSQSSSHQKAAEAPVVPFGLDLYYWGQEQPNAGKIIKSSSQHQFWVPAEVEEEVENKELLEESRSRYISFPGPFIPVTHYCNAPLGNGKLCKRQDRLKCPFHGQIIPRDPDGRPCDPKDRRREEEEERKRKQMQPEWRDAELMRDIEVATGENLGSDRVRKKGKGKRKKLSKLSDLKQSANTSRSRLEKRVFNKSAMRRVAQVLSKDDRKKHDKFSNQFNYSLN